MEMMTATLKLQAQDEPKTVLDILKGLSAHSTCEFKQKLANDGDDQRHIRHRVFSQA